MQVIDRENMVVGREYEIQYVGYCQREYGSGQRKMKYSMYYVIDRENMVVEEQQICC